MMLEIAIGDAYGRPFEFNTKEFTEANNDVKGYKHREGEEVTGIGKYTDDTQMSIAVAEQLISGMPGTQVRYAAHFVSAYKRDPRLGYSKRIKAALEESREQYPFEFIIKAKQAGMSSNGGVMRTVPLGLLQDPGEIMHRCITHVSCTHGHLDAVSASIAISLSAHFFYHLFDRIDGSLARKFSVYLEWMKDHMGVNEFNSIFRAYSLGDNNNEKLECDSKTTASISIKLAWGYNDDLIGSGKSTLANVTASSILWKAISTTGDVDSSASIGLGLYSLRSDAIMDLDEKLYNNLENDKFGRDYLTSLDAALFKKFPRKEKEKELDESIIS